MLHVCMYADTLILVTCVEANLEMVKVSEQSLHPKMYRHQSNKHMKRLNIML